VVEDAFDLAGVDAKFAGDGALVTACVVPGPYRVLHGRCARWYGWCCHCCGLVRLGRGDGCRLCGWLGLDEVMRNSKAPASANAGQCPGMSTNGEIRGLAACVACMRLSFKDEALRARTWLTIAGRRVGDLVPAG
jgi:hypothetical protein